MDKSETKDVISLKKKGLNGGKKHNYLPLPLRTIERKDSLQVSPLHVARKDSCSISVKNRRLNHLWTLKKGQMSRSLRARS